MIKKILLTLITLILMLHQSVFALTYQSYGDPNAGAINIFDIYTFENDEDWIAPENTPNTEQMYKFRLFDEAESRDKPYIHAENGDLVLPIASEFPRYDIPLNIQELRSLMQSTKDDPSEMMLKINLWYEPADVSTYVADEHYRLFDLKAYGGYVCSLCGAEREDYLMKVFGTERRCPWDSFRVPVGEQPLYDDSNELVYTAQKWKKSELIEHRVCPVEDCEGTMYLDSALLRVSLSAEDYEGVEEDGYNEIGLLPSDKVGKIHLQYLAIERAITAYNSPEQEGLGERQVIVHDAVVTENSGKYTFSAKVLNMRYDAGENRDAEYKGASFHPTMIIAGYKDGVLVDVLIKEPEFKKGYFSFFDKWTNEDLAVWGTPSQTYFKKIYGLDKSIDGYQGQILTVDFEAGDCDLIRGYMWESLESMIPNSAASLKLEKAEKN